MWIERNCSKTILEAAKYFPAVYIGGPRQAGKTSLIKKLFPKARYISLDIPSIAEKADNNPDLLLNDDDKETIIDEVQYAPNIFRYLKSNIDRNNAPGKYILSGSQNFLLMKNISESLAGRCAVISINSLSSNELINASLIKKNEFLKSIYRGGFPELWEKPDFPQDLWFSSYLSTYLERDIRNIAKIGSLRDFERFIRALAIRTGQILSYSDLARDVGIAVSTAKEWISVLQTSNQIIILEPFHKSLGKRIFKSPKVYMSDTGLVSFLIGINSEKNLFDSPLLGHLWETFVIGQIFRELEAKGAKPPVWFWRKQDGTEVDCVIEEGGKFRLLECKFSSNPGIKSFKGIKAFKKFYGTESVISSKIVCTTEEFHITDNIGISNGLTFTIYGGQ